MQEAGWEHRGQGANFCHNHPGFGFLVLAEAESRSLPWVPPPPHPGSASGESFSQRQIPLSRTLNPGRGERDNSQP